jgi:ADP-ribosylglycohydrolase
VSAAFKAKEWQQGEESDDLAERLKLVTQYKQYDAQRCIEEFGGGSCYCYHSMPFLYMFFLRNPHSVDALYDVVSAGGDADTNGSMVGAMLGAYNGQSVFPKHLVDGLYEKDLILKAANEFCSCLGVQ